jgi:hypothetical protein
MSSQSRNHLHRRQEVEGKEKELDQEPLVVSWSEFYFANSNKAIHK